MVINDEYFYNLLSVIGIYGGQKELCVKVMSIFIVFLYHISIIFCAIGASVFMLQVNFKLGLSYIFQALNSVLIWSTLFMKREKISALILEMHHFRKQCNIRNTFPYSARIFICTIILVLFILCEEYILIATYDSPYLQEFFKHHLKISEGIPFLIFTLFTGLIFFVEYSLPIIMTFILTLMLMKSAEILQFYSRSLQTEFHSITSTNFFADFLKVTKMLREMIEVVNLLLIVVYSLFCIFTSLYNIMQFKDDVTHTVIVDTLFGFISGVTILLMYSVSSSMIPENLSEIRQIARERINEHVLNLIPPIPQNALLYLRRMETEEIIYVSVYGLFRLTKSFILSATGMIFTYDLLIINAFLDPYNNTSIK